MYRSWINASRISDVYEKGVEAFLQFAKWNVAGVSTIIVNYFSTINVCSILGEKIYIHIPEPTLDIS